MASESTERRTALRALLVEQAAASAPRRSTRSHDAEPGRLRMALVTGAVAVAVVAATAVALQLPGGGAFVGAPAATSTPAPDVTSDAPSETPTQAPSTTPPALPDPTPSRAATTTEAPVPTRTPTSTPTTTPPAALIAPTGFQRITREQLHAFVTGPASTGDAAHDATYEQQMWLDIGCMADHGFVYDPIAEYSSPLAWKNGLSGEQQQAYDAAMYGPQTDQPYDWRTAGCHGLSVHETGQDDAN